MINVEHIPPQITEQDLRVLFSHAGKVENIQYFNQSKEAQIQFSDIYGRDAALLLDHMNLSNHSLSVTLTPGSKILEKYEGEPWKPQLDIVTDLVAAGYHLNPDAIPKAETYDEKRKALEEAQKQARVTRDKLRKSAADLIKKADQMEEETTKKFAESEPNWTEETKQQIEDLTTKISEMKTGMVSGASGIATELGEGMVSLSEEISEQAQTVSGMVGKAYSNLKETAQKAKEKMSEATHIAVEKVSETAHIAKEKATYATQVAVEKVSETAHIAKEKVTETAQIAKEKTTEAKQSMEDKVNAAVERLTGESKEITTPSDTEIKVTSNQYQAIPEPPQLGESIYSEMLSSSILEALSVPPEIVLPPPSPTQLPVRIDPITAEILPRLTPENISESVPKRKKKNPKGL